METEIAIFAAGCFWKPEDTFSKMKGVVKTRVGYLGGKTKKPSYENVCGGNTGHVEATEITFNSKEVSYKELLDVFWKIHNPTTKNRQGLDIGTQYNSFIFYTDPEQKKVAEESKKEEQKKIDKEIVTKIRKAPEFWEAEESHQKYVQKQKKKGIFGRLFGV